MANEDTDARLVTVYNPHGTTCCRHYDQCPGCRRCKDEMDARFVSCPPEERLAFHTARVDNPVLYCISVKHGISAYKTVYRRENGAEASTDDTWKEISERPCYVCGWTLGLKRVSTMTLPSGVDVWACEWCNGSIIHW